MPTTSAALTDWQRDARAMDFGIYHLDLRIWSHLRDAGSALADFAGSIGLCPQSANLLISADSDRLLRLASSVMCSFSFEVAPDQLCDALLAAERVSEVDPIMAIKTARADGGEVTALTREYWHLVRRTALDRGAECAELVFGLTSQVVGMLCRADALHVDLAVAQLSFNLTLRYPSSILIELLQRTYTTHHTLMSIQAMIASSTVLSQSKRERKEGRRKAMQRWIEQNAKMVCNDPSAESASAGISTTTTQLRHFDPRYQLATRMLRIGFVAPIISLETGITSTKVLTRIREEQLAAGVKFEYKTGKIPTGSKLSSYKLQVQASVLMLMYSRLAGPARRDSVQIESLMTALAMFEQIKVSADMENPYKWPNLDPSLAFGLAQEMRGYGVSQEAFLTKCDGCSSTYLISTNQHGRADLPACPFCRVKDAERQNIA